MEGVEGEERKEERSDSEEHRDPAFRVLRVGWKGYLYCLGIAAVTPFLLDTVLEKWNAGKLFKSAAAVALAAALASLVLLAVIRGDLLAEQIQNLTPAITFDDAQPASPPAQAPFYDRTLVDLRLAMALLTVAMELGSGLALHEAWQMSSSSLEDWEQLRARVSSLRERMIVLTQEITSLENEAAIYTARVWRNFYRALLTHTARAAMTKLLFACTVGIALLSFGVQASAQVQLNLVIAVDLTQSVAMKGPYEKSDFEKNLDAVTRLLTEVSSNSRVTIIGITDQSFAEPDILLSATIPTDPGYFGQRLNSARMELTRAWKRRSLSLKPEFRRTDVIGALLLASQIFEGHPEAKQKTLVLFSDMRHCTHDLDLESPSVVPSFSRLEKQAHINLADLHGVQVFALGVDGAGKTLAYWQSLREFWVEYFRYAGASLTIYTVLRVWN